MRQLHDLCAADPNWRLAPCQRSALVLGHKNNATGCNRFGDAAVPAAGEALLRPVQFLVGMQSEIAGPFVAVDKEDLGSNIPAEHGSHTHLKSVARVPDGRPPAAARE